MVQGLRGERQHYRAVRSSLVAGSDPLAIARALCHECVGRAVYVADLDAIAGTGDHRGVIGELRARLGSEPWVDAGVSDAETAARLLEAGATRVIVGTETLPDLGALQELRDSLPPGRLLVSIDVGTHGVLSRCHALAGVPPLAALELLADEGVTEVILLALPQVGTGAGPDLETLRAARAAFPHVQPGRRRRRAHPRRPAGARWRRRRRPAARDRASSRLDHRGGHQRHAVRPQPVHQRAVSAGTSASIPPSVKKTKSDAATRSAVVPGLSAWASSPSSRASSAR